MPKNFNVIVVGAGQVGSRLAKKLFEQNCHVTLIDSKQENLATIQDQDLDILTILGNGASPDILKEAGIEKANLLLAVTNFDEINMLACLVAQTFGVLHKIARIRDKAYSSEKNSALFMDKLGIDAIINPEVAVVKEIVQMLQLPGAIEVSSFGDDRIQEAGFKLNNPEFHNKTVAEVAQKFFPSDIVLAAIHRGTGTIIPRGKDILFNGDQVYLVGKPKQMKKAARIVSGMSEGTHRYMIFGGSRVGIELALTLEKTDARVTLIEPSPEKCKTMANLLNNSLIIQGSGTDLELLKKEGITQAEAFIAATERDETNIVACLLAKHQGVLNIISLIGRANYQDLLPQIGIPTAISAEAATAGAILKFARNSRVLNIFSSRDGQSEIFEVIVPKDCKIINQPLKDIPFPNGSLISAIVNNEGVTIPRGETIIYPEDRLIIFALPEAIKEIETLLNTTQDSQFFSKISKNLFSWVK